jgi:hypothetical protein
MTLDSFLKNLQNPSFLNNYCVIVFVGGDYPLLFFSLFKQYISKNTGNRFLSLDGEQADLAALQTELSMSLLVEKSFYWCNNVHTMPTEKREAFLKYSLQYAGPHVLWFFAEQAEQVSDLAKQNNTICIVQLPAEATKQIWNLLQELFFPASKQKSAVFDTLFEQSASISLDKACLLLQYGTLIHQTQLKYFINEWLKDIVVPEQSLFTLSGYLFAKKSTLFYETWLSMKDTYPPQFWISFWSEQVFRAACFINYARAEKFTEAKKVAFRLPFTFIKKDWKLFSLKSLIEAHDLLYQLDHSVKNGGDAALPFDIFYSKFFVNE